MGITRRDFIRQMFGLLALPVVGRASRPFAVEPATVRYRLERFHVAGFRYYDGPRLVAQLRPGDRLLLRAEPENPHDARAVEVYLGQDKLGYVPRRRNATLSRLLAQGAHVEGCVRAVDLDAEPWRMVEAEAFLTVPVASGARHGLASCFSR